MFLCFILVNMRIMIAYSGHFPSHKSSQSSYRFLCYVETNIKNILSLHSHSHCFVCTLPVGKRFRYQDFQMQLCLASSWSSYFSISTHTPTRSPHFSGPSQNGYTLLGSCDLKQATNEVEAKYLSSIIRTFLMVIKARHYSSKRKF